MNSPSLSKRKRIAGYALSPFWKFVLAVSICEGAGIISGLLSQPGMSTWFERIDKPEWNPPSWVFGPVWTLLYFLMGISLG